MGLFISNCPYCSTPVHWFLNVPKNYICKKCNGTINEHEIEEEYCNLINRYNEQYQLLKNILFEYDKGCKFFSSHVDDMFVRYQHEYLGMYPLLNVKDLKYAFDYPEVYLKLTETLNSGTINKNEL